MFEEDQSHLTLTEIYSQARSCRSTVEQAGDRLRILEELFPLDQYTDIVLTGCGSSHHLAACASFAWSELLARPVMAVAASELAHFPEHYLRSDARPLIIAISRSGGTTEVKLAVERLRRDYRASALAITGEAGGSMAGACDLEIAFTECHEASVVTTQAFTCMLTGLYLLADGATGNKRASEITQIPGLIGTTLEATEEAVRAIAEDPGIERFFFLGSGAMKGLADECVLKMTEMALETAFTYRALEFRHGPKAILNSRDQLVIFPVRAESRYLATLIEEIEATDARWLVIGPPELSVENGPSPGFARSPGCSVLTIAGEVSEVFRPALCAHAGQLLAYWRAEARGLNPDRPPHLVRTVLLGV
jgi:fructoselysine-6-P-deglycase FrlB-like protein